jgi:hypothetical protein
MKALLLNADYRPLNFISERRAFRHFFNGKVDIISSWDSIVYWNNGSLKIPAVLRLKHNIKYFEKPCEFSRNAIFVRDNYICQYCEVKLSKHNATVDHILPVSFGGKNSWKNCVTCCNYCNSEKRNRTPEQAGMELICEPKIPESFIVYKYLVEKNKHPDWDMFLSR